MKKNIWLIRHGQTDYNAANKIQGSGIDAPLNSLGMAQAALVATALKAKLGNTSVLLHSSTLKRAVQTAEFIAKELETELFVAEEIEEMNFGILEGVEIDGIQTELSRLHELWEAGEVDKGAEAGESPTSAFERASTFIINTIEETQKTDCVFVVHGRLLRILLAGWLDQDLAKMSKYEHHNANINLLEYADKTFSVISLNETKHLASLN